MGRRISKDGGRKPKVEVVFDPDARKDYLTGFHKRKVARRRFGLAMQEIKDRKERLEERKERREAFKERREELGVQEDLDSFDIKARAREEAKAKADEQVRVDFEDGHTQTMFGDTVTVTTVEGIPDSDDEDAIEMERLERELLEEKKRLRAERVAGKGRGGGGRVYKPGKVGRGVAGSAEGTAEERWSLAAVSKRLAANMPTKPRKGSTKRGGSSLGAETSLEKGKKKGKKGKKGTAAGAGGIAGAGAASALVDKARGSLPRTELSKGKKRKKR